LPSTTEEAIEMLNAKANAYQQQLDTILPIANEVEKIVSSII